MLFINTSLKCEHESDGVSTWAKLDGCTYKQCPFMHIGNVCCCLQTFEPIVHIVPSTPRFVSNFKYILTRVLACLIRCVCLLLFVIQM